MISIARLLKQFSLFGIKPDGKRKEIMRGLRYAEKREEE